MVKQEISAKSNDFLDYTFISPKILNTPAIH